MSKNATRHRAILIKIARRAMIEHGLLPDYSPEALTELDRIRHRIPVQLIPTDVERGFIDFRRVR